VFPALRSLGALAGVAGLAAGLAGCPLSGGTTYPSCAIEDLRAEPASAAPGDRVRLYASPLTEDWDTVVTIGSARASIERLVRQDCDPCDNCIAEDTAAGWNACPQKADCHEDDCADCVEYVTVVVPELAGGRWAVEVRNSYGVSGGGSIEVVADSPGKP
jgi:hypothetical protein